MRDYVIADPAMEVWSQNSCSFGLHTHQGHPKELRSQQSLWQSRLHWNTA